MAEFDMPEFYAPFPLECNPHLEEASKAMWEWIDAYGLADTRRARDRMRRTGADLSGAYLWPHAGPEVLKTGVKWLALTFRIDDQIDEDAADDRLKARETAVEELCDILHGRPGRGRSPVSRALEVLWAATCAGRPADWRSAFVGHFEAFLRSYATEARLSARGLTPQLDEYFDWRVYSVGMLWLWDLDELRLPVFLPDSVRACPAMGKLRRAASLHIALVNDVFSVSREILVGYPFNAVIIIRNMRRCSLQEAVNHLASLVSAHAGTVIEARQELLTELNGQALPPEERAAALAYAANVAANLRGQLVWHSAVERYAVDDLRIAGPSASYPDDLLPRG